MSGRSERAASARGRAHRPNLNAFYRGRKDPITPGEFEFKLEANAGGGWFSIDDVVESFTWEDTDSVLTGSLSLAMLDRDRPSSPVQNGYRVRCRTRWAGKTYEVWEMRAQPETADPTGGFFDVPLTDDLIKLRRNRRDWRFRKTKKRPRGWFAHEIVREVARREGLRIGRIARGTKRISKLVLENASALDVIKAAYREEAEETGRRFIVRMRAGKLEVIPYQRNELLYVFKDELEGVTLSYEQAQRPVTVLEAKGRIGKGKAAKKVQVDVMNKAVVRRFGFSQETKDFGRVASRAQLKGRAQRVLANKIRARRTAEVDVAGIPFIRRGDGVRWQNKVPGWHGPSRSSRDRTYVFVTAISHSVTGRRYTMRMTWEQTDPFKKDKERREKEARDKKKAARAKK